MSAYGLTKERSTGSVVTGDAVVTLAVVVSASAVVVVGAVVVTALTVVVISVIVNEGVVVVTFMGSNTGELSFEHAHTIAVSARHVIRGRRTCNFECFFMIFSCDLRNRGDMSA